ncbi:nucleotidyltransferase domain-containing protein [Candidatus Woesearchaeota archaeon]|nr:nucleotidyltransferase domain-containing protein [Candidatus Woesearchaeota archaeon]
MDQHKLKEYASTFVTFLLRNMKDTICDIDEIILYGSVAKGEAEERSDIDIFVNTKTKKIVEKIKRIAKGFPESREALLYKVEGISNEVSVKVGELRKWQELQRSIMGTGIVLWGKYVTTEKPASTRHYLLVSWDKIEKNRGAFLNKVYGFQTKGKKYEGLIHNIQGKRVGKSCILVPIQEKEKVLPLLKKYHVHARQLDIFLEG